jgi:hypothetical protein
MAEDRFFLPDRNNYMAPNHPDQPMQSPWRKAEKFAARRKFPVPDLTGEIYLQHLFSREGTLKSWMCWLCTTAATACLLALFYHRTN